jgi:hypothetical protein
MPGKTPTPDPPQVSPKCRRGLPWDAVNSGFLPAYRKAFDAGKKGVPKPRAPATAPRSRSSADQKACFFEGYEQGLKRGYNAGKRAARNASRRRRPK